MTMAVIIFLCIAGTILYAVLGYGALVMAKTSPHVADHKSGYVLCLICWPLILLIAACEAGK